MTTFQAASGAKLPADYVERVYAGVLGKIIGVYIGRPFEGWTNERIERELGEVWYYVHERLGKPLIVTDDDIAGTFTFLRALPDYGNARDLTPQQIAQTWLNYIVEKRSILWWGGFGNSTEHTAFLRLKAGVPAPASGSIALNGQVVAEQIGAQIFVDGWAMVAPGDPALAADLARRAGSVSHDGEAIYGAQVLAAMESLAFVEPDLNRLLDCGLSFVPRDSVIARLIADLREWRAVEPDWRKAFGLLAGKYGYDKYGGNCHIVPNHGLMMLSLLYGDDDFQKVQMIVNTGGWDTDCNAGNVGCLMGIKNGLAGLQAGADFRGPVADRLYLSTADGGRAISDAVAETYAIVNSGRALRGLAPLAPKEGARFHFGLPGAVQGFQVEESVECRGTALVENVESTALDGSSGDRALAIRYRGVARGRSARVGTPTFTPPEGLAMPGYVLMASPTLYPGQTIRAALAAGANAAPTDCGLCLRVYDASDSLAIVRGPRLNLAPGERRTVEWTVPPTGGQPIAEVGVEIRAGNEVASERRADGTIYLDYLTWSGSPDVVLARPTEGGTIWRRAWVDATDEWGARYPEAYRLVQNVGTGMLIQGTREWTDYRASATLTPHLVTSCGLAARVQGLRRYYALLLSADGVARLVKELDGTRTLAEAPFALELGRPYDLSVSVVGDRIAASVDGETLFDLVDADQPLTGGAVALVVTEGRVASDAVAVRPA